MKKPYVGQDIYIIPGTSIAHLVIGDLKPEDPVAAKITRVWSNGAVSAIAFPDSNQPVAVMGVPHIHNVHEEGQGYWYALNETLTDAAPETTPPVTQ